MAELKVEYGSSFTLTSTWTCTWVYNYGSGGVFTSVYSRTQGTPTRAYKNVTFSNIGLPNSAKILSAKLHVSHTGTGYLGISTDVGLTAPDTNGFIELDVDTLDFSSGELEFQFVWYGYQHGSNTHDNDYPSATAAGVQTKTFNHSYSSTVSDVYLQIEYQSGSVIYHAENGVLVPYQLFHAENGVLVPYQIQHGESGSLVSYG